MWLQSAINLSPRTKGFHLVTDDIIEQLPDLAKLKVGVAHFFIKHTSASITINENADPTVRLDMESHFNYYVPENQIYYQHDYEGPDDMPAHIKASLLGSSVSIPIHNGHLALGIWQGIYLGEHRYNATSRTIIVTLNGE
jgi:secondary thiamine-phosphate synthase enzyme